MQGSEKKIQIPSWLIYVFLALSVVMAASMYLFHVNDFIDHPAFPLEPDYAKNASTIKGNNLAWFRLFFITDFFWALAGLLIVYLWVNALWVDIEHKKVKQWAFLPLCGAAYFSDFLENSLYLMFRNDMLWGWFSLQAIVRMKMLFYALVLLFLLLGLFRKYISPNFSAFKVFLKASSVSILVILALGLLLTQMDQGGTIVVDLLDRNALNVVVLFLFLNSLAMACSHYPDYIQRNSDDAVNLRWQRTKVFPEFDFLGVGLITYTMKSSQEVTDEKAEHRQKTAYPLPDHLRKNLGTLFLITWVGILFYVLKSYVYPRFPVEMATLLVLGLATLLYSRLVKIKEKWYRDFSKMKKKREAEGIPSGRISPPEYVNSVLSTTLVLFIVFLIFLTLTTVLVQLKRWDLVTWVCIVLTSLINISAFIYFRVFRTALSYYEGPSFLTYVPIYTLKSDVQYVGYFSFMGFLALFTAFLSHFTSALFNPMVIFLVYFYLLYGAIIIPIKHHYYYKDPDPGDEKKWLSSAFKHYVPVLGFVVLAITIFSGQAGNKLHVLETRPEDTNGLVDESEFVNRLAEQIKANPDQPIYLIAAHGGGLRANAWTMLVLDELRKRNKEVFKTTAGMSGVSGGFLGLAMYSALMHEDRGDATRIAQKIDSVAKHNFLSNDLTYLMGFDLLRELVPYADFSCPDRAGMSMREYASILQPSASDRRDLLEESYRQYWSGIFHSEMGYWPALIGNSTGTHERHGAVFSVQTNQKHFNQYFPGSDNMLDLRVDNMPGSISYLDAVSTTNRFPIFSPTAQIEGKGHYLDGGYFENSGLLSLVNFFDGLRNCHPVIDSLAAVRGVTIIQIANSEESSLSDLIPDILKGKTELASGEFQAILGTVSSISILPAAMEAKLRLKYGPDHYIKINLPYLLGFEDIVQHMRGKPLNPHEVIDSIQVNNQRILGTLNMEYPGRFGNVPPPLARVLSEPSVEYMRAMLSHPEVSRSLANVGGE